MEIVVRDGRIELPASSMSMKRSTTELIARGSGNISYSRPFWYRASMSEILLYPTETLYALGVNALDSNALEVLLTLKGRDHTKTPSWLVRTLDDVHEYAEVSDVAARIAHKFLPGPLTLVLPALPHVTSDVIASDRTIGFRVSSDPIAIRMVAEFGEQQGAPLTCTSANVSGAPTLQTPAEILQQFGEKASAITHVIDDGTRKALAPTVVRVVGSDVTVLREGEIPERALREVVKDV